MCKEKCIEKKVELEIVELFKKLNISSKKVDKELIVRLYLKEIKE